MPYSCGRKVLLPVAGPCLGSFQSAGRRTCRKEVGVAVLGIASSGDERAWSPIISLNITASCSGVSSVANRGRRASCRADGIIAIGTSSSSLRLSNRCTRSVAYSISTSSGAVTVAFVPAVLVLLPLEPLPPPLPSLLDELLLLLGRASALLLLSRAVGLLHRDGDGERCDACEHKRSWYA